MTFTEFFKELQLENSDIGQLAYILDAPEAMFNAVKNDMTKAILEDLNSEAFLEQINNGDVTLAELKEGSIETYNTFVEMFESKNDLDLPQDRIEFLLEYLAALRDKILELPERKIIKVVCEKLDDGVILPTYAHNTDAGADIYANEDVEIAGNSTAIVKTGLKVAIPVGWELQIRPRSGMSAKTPIRVANAPGTIDSKKGVVQWAA